MISAIAKSFEMKRVNYLLPRFFCLSCIVLLVSCNPAPNLTPMQIREITTKLYDADFENTYRATVTVLQDQGYTIKMTDMNSGLINATVDRKTSKGSQIFQALMTGNIANKGSKFELNLHEAQYGEASVFSGTSEQDSKQIYDPKVYKELFDQIGVEILRRIAIKKQLVDTKSPKLFFSNPAVPLGPWAFPGLSNSV